MKKELEKIKANPIRIIKKTASQQEATVTRKSDIKQQSQEEKKDGKRV